MAKTHRGSASRLFTNTTYQEDQTLGDTWYVDSNHSLKSDAAGSGQSPDAPFATIGYATATAATASNGDLVIVAPGHAETVVGAGGIAMSKIGVKVRGNGSGRNRPVISYTTSAAASVDISAASCSIENVTFKVLGVDAVTAAVNVTAADVSLKNCEFELADATNQAVLGVLTSALADRLVIDDCFFHGSADAGTTAAVKIVGGDGVQVKNNTFQGAYSASVGAVQQATTTTTNFLLSNNLINNLTASSTKAAVFTASSTGIISRNQVQILSGAAPFTGVAMAMIGNSYASTIATDTSASNISASIGTITNSGGTATIGGVLGDVANVSLATRTAVTNTGGTATLNGALGDVANVSVASRLIQGVPRLTTYTKADVTAATAWTTGNSPVTIFTVTGDVLITNIYGVVTTALTSASNNGTIALGVSGATGGFIAATTLDATILHTAGFIWTTTGGILKIYSVPGSGAPFAVGTNTNIILTIATNSASAGGMTIYCQWIPMSAGATVV